MCVYFLVVVGGLGLTKLPLDPGHDVTLSWTGVLALFCCPRLLCTVLGYWRVLAGLLGYR